MISLYIFLVISSLYVIHFLMRIRQVIVRGLPTTSFSLPFENYPIIINEKTKRWTFKFDSLSVVTISKIIHNHFIKRNIFKDNDLLQNVEIVLYEDKISNIKSYRKTLYDVESWTTKYLIYINLHHIKEENDVQFAELFLHEYIHFWMKKHRGSSDENHTSTAWNLIHQDELIKHTLNLKKG